MSAGFIFKSDRCVNCGSCAAACIMENGWVVRPREILTFNAEASVSLPLFNLSLACNHCEVPACLNGCPASAYYRDHSTGAILIDDSRCIGCKYCLWNCPYDAPKFNEQKRVIEKCHLCHTLITDGLNPACATACPTGALSFGELPVSAKENMPEWFPDKKLNPAIHFSGLLSADALSIEPPGIFKNEMLSVSVHDRSRSEDASLIVFTLLATLSTAVIVAALIKGEFPSAALTGFLLAASAIASFFHLGKPERAWRALSNIAVSPLSREIALFILFALITLSALTIQLPFLLAASAISGTLLLLIIDSVYLFSDKRTSRILNSGQTVISMLIIASFLAGLTVPFIFMGAVKLFLSSFSLLKDEPSGSKFKLRFIRIALLAVSLIVILSRSYINDTAIALIFLTGEILDRILFYLDFDPVNVRRDLAGKYNSQK